MDRRNKIYFETEGEITLGRTSKRCYTQFLHLAALLIHKSFIRLPSGFE